MKQIHKRVRKCTICKVKITVMDEILRHRTSHTKRAYSDEGIYCGVNSGGLYGRWVCNKCFDKIVRGVKKNV